MILKSRWDKLPKNGPIVGIRTYHEFDPIDGNSITCKLISNFTNAVVFKIVNKNYPGSLRRLQLIQQAQVGDFVVADFNKKWWLARIQLVDLPRNELLLSYLHPSGPSRTFFFPKKADQLPVHLRDVVGVLVDTPVSGEDKAYRLNKNQSDHIEHLYKNF
jgi:hypothetical protein